MKFIPYAVASIISLPGLVILFFVIVYDACGGASNCAHHMGVIPTDRTARFLYFMKHFTRLIFVAAILSLTGCWLAPKKLDYSDVRLQPFWKAVAEVNRASLGFGSISPHSDVRLESWTTSAHYDSMLHIEYGHISRTIAFRKSGSGYRWTGEQEIHEGPKTYTTVDGTFYEEITITAPFEGTTTTPAKTVEIYYNGDDPQLTWPRRLTMDSVRPIIAKWDSLPPH